MPNLSNFINKLSFAVIFSLALASIAVGQNTVDLELKVQPSAETVRGGETFSYSLTVKNVGMAKATDVVFNHDEPKMTRFVAYAPSKGKCTIDESQGYTDRTLNCELDNMEPGESIVISIEIKIYDFGDVSEDENKNTGVDTAPLINLGKSIAAMMLDGNNSIGDARVSAEEPEENTENNSAEIFVKLLPSKNIPPRVEIISPKYEENIIRPLKKPTHVTFAIKAFDPDGTVEKVVVHTQQFQISVEYPENKYVIDGVKYSIKEVEENMPRFQKYFGGDAVKTGKDTYTFTLENPNYGSNLVTVEAVDNGGRGEGVPVRFTVVSGSSIEMNNPLMNAVIKPNTDVVIETTTKLNDGKLAKVVLTGDGVCCAEVLMKQISQVGNVYRHQYVLKNVTKNHFNLQAVLIEDSGAITYSNSVIFNVTERPTIKITSANNQIIKVNENFPVEMEVSDPDGRITNINVTVNGKSEIFSWEGGVFGKKGYVNGLRKGTYTIQAKVMDDLDVTAESEPLTVIVR